MILDISFNRGMKAIIKLCKESSLLNVNLICVGLRPTALGWSEIAHKGVFLFIWSFFKEIGNYSNRLKKKQFEVQLPLKNKNINADAQNC